MARRTAIRLASFPRPNALWRGLPAPEPVPAKIPMTLTLADIQAAAGRIAGHVERTPCRRSRTLSEARAMYRN